MKLGSDISAIVTGGGSGLGEASARMLAAAGVKVSILDVNEMAGKAVASSINAFYCPCDVTNPSNIASALDEARGINGQERILVNAAGVAIGMKTVTRDRQTGAILPHNLESFAKVISVNLLGTFNMTSLCAAGMMTLDPVNADGSRGVIVSTASVAAEDGQVGQAAYAASKGGVVAMTLPIARDLARDGIRVASIMPGLFDTPMLAGIPKDVKENLEQSVPFPSRLGKPAEYADLVKHICENEMLNGVSIRLDGAVRLSAK